jgi:DNA modification methylase
MAFSRFAEVECLLDKKHSNPGDTVMDCFSGSGTTCLAAIQLGRKFIGCELSEEYWRKSVDRINSEANIPNEKDAIAANSTLDLFC